MGDCVWARRALNRAFSAVSGPAREAQLSPAIAPGRAVPAVPCRAVPSPSVAFSGDSGVQTGEEQVVPAAPPPSPEASGAADSPGVAYTGYEDTTRKNAARRN
jgi:hypothetical protein